MKAGEMGKKHRLKLKYLLSYFPAVLKRYAKKQEEAEQDESIKSAVNDI